jgi:hypothetical protein
MSLSSYLSVARQAAATPDPFDLMASDTHNADGNGAYSPNGVYPGLRNTNGRVQVDAALVAGQKTLILIGAGQSNICSVAPTAYTASNALSHCLNIYDGFRSSPAHGSAASAIRSLPPVMPPASS